MEQVQPAIVSLLVSHHSNATATATTVRGNGVRSVPVPAPTAGVESATRPTRIGGAPLTGVNAVGMYRATAAIDAVRVLSRVDEIA